MDCQLRGASSLRPHILASQCTTKHACHWRAQPRTPTLTGDRAAGGRQAPSHPETSLAPAASRPPVRVKDTMDEAQRQKQGQGQAYPAGVPILPAGPEAGTWGSRLSSKRSWRVLCPSPGDIQGTLLPLPFLPATSTTHSIKTKCQGKDQDVHMGGRPRLLARPLAPLGLSSPACGTSAGPPRQARPGSQRGGTDGSRPQHIRQLLREWGPDFGGVCCARSAESRAAGPGQSRSCHRGSGGKVAVCPLSVLQEPRDTVLQGLGGRWEGRAQEEGCGQAFPPFLGSSALGAKPAGSPQRGLQTRTFSWDSTQASQPREACKAKPPSCRRQIHRDQRQRDRDLPPRRPDTRASPQRW